jgi:hypothetical protein
MKSMMIAAAAMIFASAAYAQSTAEFDGDSFADELNAALSDEGVTGATVATASIDAPTGDIGRAVETIADATDYIAERLCSRRSRPTKLVLHLTAGFNLVFSGETGSQVEWDLEIVCNRP